MPKLKNCPSCFNAPAQVHRSLGLLPCIKCQKRQDALLRPSPAIEIIPDRIKQEREERADSIEQPHLKGELNKRWLDLYGVKAAKNRGFTDKEIKNAKYVFDRVRTKNTAHKYYKEQT